MRARLRMSEERADLVGGSRRENVLELAGLLLDFGFAVHGEAIGEQAFGQPVTANDASGAATASRCQGNHGATVTYEHSVGAHGVMARIHKRLVGV